MLHQYLILFLKLVMTLIQEAIQLNHGFIKTRISLMKKALTALQKHLMKSTVILRALSALLKKLRICFLSLKLRMHITLGMKISREKKRKRKLFLKQMILNTITK